MATATVAATATAENTSTNTSAHKTRKPHYHRMSYADAAARGSLAATKNEPAVGNNSYYHGVLWPPADCFEPMDGRSLPMTRVHFVSIDCESLGPNIMRHDMPAFGGSEWSDWENSSDFWRSPPKMIKSERWILPFDMARSDQATLDTFWKVSAERWAMLMSWSEEASSRPGTTAKDVATNFSNWLEETELRLNMSGIPPPVVISDNIFFDIKLMDHLLDSTGVRPSLDYHRVFEAGSIETKEFMYGPQPRSISDSFRCLLPGGVDKQRGVLNSLRHALQIPVPSSLKEKTHDPKHDSELAGYLYCMLRRAAICRDEHQRYPMYSHAAWSSPSLPAHYMQPIPYLPMHAM